MLLMLERRKMLPKGKSLLLKNQQVSKLSSGMVNISQMSSKNRDQGSANHNSGHMDLSDMNSFVENTPHGRRGSALTNF